MQRRSELLLLLFAAVAMLPIATAQETTTGFQGVVKDPTSAVVANATVEVYGPALIGTRKAQTNEAGIYRFAALPPGEYTMTVGAPGFRTYKQAGISLSVGRFANIDVTLVIGAVAETVEVSGA